ncbi:MAG: CDP-alcohol phosphatidyltransferase family protein [Xanthomonadales bacterium]|nr:CDP-alcohol phosphatidyltransferase family protein [Xanthomonadales bacterium]
MSLSLLPNVLTIFRMIVVGPIVYTLLTGQYVVAFYLAMAAAVSDLLDGYLARRFGWMTHWGGVLDPLADKFLLVSTTLTLAWLGYLPWWLVGLIVLRDVVIVTGGYYYHFRIARLATATPTNFSKWNTLFQILLVVSVMLSLAFPATEGPWIEWLVWLTALTTLASGLQYVVIWSNKAKREREKARDVQSA